MYRVDLEFPADAPITAGCPINLTNSSTVRENVPDGSIATPSWPDGRIAFNVLDDPDQLIIFDPVLGGDSRVVDVSDQASFVGRVHWSPDASRLVFAASGNRGNDVNLYAVGADGTDLVNLTPTKKATETAPARRPDEFIHCDGNGINDSVDIARDPSLDGDGDGIPDACP